MRKPRTHRPITLKSELLSALAAVDFNAAEALLRRTAKAAPSVEQTAETNTAVEET